MTIPTAALRQCRAPPLQGGPEKPLRPSPRDADGRRVSDMWLCDAINCRESVIARALHHPASRDWEGDRSESGAVAAAICSRYPPAAVQWQVRRGGGGGLPSALQPHDRRKDDMHGFTESML